MEDGIVVKSSEIKELARLTSEINDRVESLELMNNEEFIVSLKKAKNQIKNRDFADWEAI